MRTMTKPLVGLLSNNDEVRTYFNRPKKQPQGLLTWLASTNQKGQHQQTKGGLLNDQTTSDQ